MYSEVSKNVLYKSVVEISFFLVWIPEMIVGYIQITYYSKS